MQQSHDYDLSGTPELISQALEEQGSPFSDAFTQLIKRYQDYLYGYVYSLNSDPVLSQDIVQDSFIEAFLHLESLKNPEVFASWLRTIAFRTNLKYKRKQTGTHGTIFSEELFPCSHYNPEAQFDKSELQKEIDSAITDFKKEYRRVFDLYYIEGLSQKEIAVKLGISVDAVKKRLHRCRIQFKEKMKHMETFLPSKDKDFIKNINLALSFNRSAWMGELCFIEAMLVDGYDVNQGDQNGRTLLHLAAGDGNEEAVELLLKWGANPRLEDNRGKTAIQWAKKQRHMRITRLLEKHNG